MTDCFKGKVNAYVKQGKEDVQGKLEYDKRAGDNLNCQSLKLIYNGILYLAYSLLTVGITITLSTDAQTRTMFFEFLGKTSSIIYVSCMTLLAVISYMLSKAHHKDANYSPKTKKQLNFIDDIVKGSIFLLMVIFITGFVRDHTSKVSIIIAYAAFLISMVLFKILHIIKWYVYCIGKQSDNEQPWKKPITGTTHIMTAEQ